MAAVGRVEVTLKDRGPQPEDGDPLPARVARASWRRMQSCAGRASRSRPASACTPSSVRGDLSMTRWRIDVDPFVVEDPAGRVDGNVFLRGTLPLGLRGEVSGRWRLPDERTYRFSARVKGRLDRLGIDVALTEPAKLAFSGNRPRPQPRSARRGHAARRRIRRIAVDTPGTTAAGQRFALGRRAASTRSA